MKNKTVEDARRCKVLKEVGRGYETGDFSGLYPYLRKGCVLTSCWVLTCLLGSGAIVNYYDGKGEELLRRDCLARTTVVELVDDKTRAAWDGISAGREAVDGGRAGIQYEPGKYCLLMEQAVSGVEISILVDVKLDEEGMVRRIHLCDPAMFHLTKKVAINI